MKKRNPWTREKRNAKRALSKAARDVIEFDRTPYAPVTISMYTVAKRRHDEAVKNFEAFYKN